MPRRTVPHGPPPVLRLPPATPQPALPPRFRTVVWNTLKARRDNWSAQFEDLLSGRHLALLQEAWLTPKADGMHADLLHTEWEWLLAVSWVDRGGAQTGVATGSPVVSSCTDALRSPDREPLLRTPKTALVTCYPIGDTTLLVVNVHAVNAVGLKAQKRQLDDLEQHIRAHTGPVLLGGDFNTQTAKKLRQLRALASRNDLREVELDTSDAQRSAVFGNPLDHVFVRGLTVHHAAVLGVQTSDHNPLLLDLELAR